VPTLALLLVIFIGIGVGFWGGFSTQEKNFTQNVGSPDYIQGGDPRTLSGKRAKMSPSLLSPSHSI